MATLDIDTAAAAMESLGNPVRLEIFRQLIRTGSQGLPVGALQDRLDIPNSTLSHHIQHLVTRNLVSQNREGRVLRCTANFTTMNSLLAFLMAECCIESDD